MIRSTFKQLFYINRQKVKKNGKCPVMGRITLDSKISQYSTGLEVHPDLWNPDTGRATFAGRKAEMLSVEEKEMLRTLNRELEKCELKAQDAYKENVAQGYVSAEIIKNAVTGKNLPKDTLLTLFDEHNEEYAKRVGIDRVRPCLVRYLTTRKHIASFLEYKHGMADIPLRSLDMQFIEDFEFYLSTVRKIAMGTFNTYLINLHKVAKLAVKQHTLKRDPFLGYKIKPVPPKHRFLTGEQFAKILTAELDTYRLCHTRDLFVFSCFTGLGRADLANLKEEDIVTEEDGSKWIHIARQKTKADCHIKLLDIPLQIIEKYKGEGKEGKLFFVPITPCICQTFKLIEKECKLDFHLTFYMARHSFATLICLSNGMPIETISKMMGHRSIRTTQIYAEITGQKVGRDMEKLAESLNEAFGMSEKEQSQVVNLRKRKTILQQT